MAFVVRPLVEALYGLPVPLIYPGLFVDPDISRLEGWLT